MLIQYDTAHSLILGLRYQGPVTVALLLVQCRDDILLFTRYYNMHILFVYGKILFNDYNCLTLVLRSSLQNARLS